MTKICNAKLFVEGTFREGGIVFNERILAVGKVPSAGALDAAGAYLLPGLIDLHSHAAMGADASDGDPAGLDVLGRWYASKGVTSWCPATMTLPEPVLLRAMEVLRGYRRGAYGAKLLGANLEGPFLSAARRGAQRLQDLRPPDLDLFHRLDEASGGRIRLVTVAPELPGALAFIRAASRQCTVALGHTAASYAQAMAAFDAGASHLTHLYHAMPPFHHREPGPIGAAFDAGASTELIADGTHSRPTALRLAFRLFGGRLALISDSMRCAGLPDGHYTLGGQDVAVRERRAVLAGTDTLAGSTIHLLDGLRTAVSCGVPLEGAVQASTLVPARILGLEGEIGSLGVGKAADLLVLDEHWNVKAVYIDGKPVG